MPESSKAVPAILSVRLSDEDNPKRAEDFERALAKGGATATNVVKALVDAYTTYVTKNDRLPSFPLEVDTCKKKSK